MTDDEKVSRMKYLNRLLEEGFAPEVLIGAYGFTKSQIMVWPSRIAAEEAKRNLRRSKKISVILDALGVRHIVSLRSVLRKIEDPKKALKDIPGIGEKTVRNVLEVLRLP